MMRQVVLICSVLASLIAAAYAMNCYMCNPAANNNFCTDTASAGYPAKATQSMCNGYCFKANGNLKIPNANDQGFVVADCITQAQADVLNVGGNDWCKSGDDAKRFFQSMMVNPSQTPASQQYGLPGKLDYVNYCKCDKDLCNSAVSISTTSVSIVMAIASAMAVKMFY